MKKQKTTKIIKKKSAKRALPSNSALQNEVAQQAKLARPGKLQNKKIAISLKGITKTYQLKHEKPTFSEQLFKGFKKEKFDALRNLDLTVYKGERLGIRGKNGTGKTTLLKIIAGITTPNQGTLVAKGKVVSLIDLEAGFHPDLTGEENIFLNASLLGMSKKETREKYSKITSFAQLNTFIDTPLYTYSYGMKLRLGFAIAIHSNPDILLLDENIIVGDAQFQSKVSIYFDSFFKRNKTAIIVSHVEEYLQKMCTRIVDISSLQNKN